MRSSRKKRETQVKEDLAKPIAQQELQGLVEFIHALTAQAVETKEKLYENRSENQLG